MKTTVNILMVLSLILMTGLPLSATILPPPANQFIGINDGVFNDLVEDDCRLCHENPDQYPVEDETIPNRHHLLAGTEIPDPTDAPYGTPGELFACLSCHESVINGGIFEFIVERDCLLCHTQSSPHEVTVHHRSDLALGLLPQGPDCKACHGSLVDNMDDGHFISAEPTTDQTPKRSGGNGLPLNSEGTGAGGCDYCHSTGTGSMSPGIDSFTGVLVYDNETTHHGTLYFGSTPTEEDLCHWCHDFSIPFQEQIRVCEKCHGRDALHNIQVDSDGDGIINPGIEAPGYGHIGDPDDCWGCHGFSFMSSSAPPEFGPIIPQIFSTNKSIITAGSTSVLTITGSAFRNSGGETEYTSVVTLTASDDSMVELIPDSITESTISVTIPDTLNTGNYSLRAVKLDKLSNPVNLSITPEVAITDIDCSKCLGTMTIIGSGFSEKPDGSDEDISLVENGRPLNIISWTDGEIMASGARCSGTVEVDAIFGSASQSHE